MRFSENGESASVSRVAIRMRRFGAVLATGEKGDEARREIEREIAALEAGAPVVFDFAGVRVISVPFADQSIGQLLGGRLAGYYEEHPLLALNANEDVRETLAAALRQRRLTLLSISESGAELLAGDPVLQATMEVALSLGEFSVAELAQELGLTVQAANNRLRMLLDSGALSRSRIVPTRGGREFRYAVPAPWLLAEAGTKRRTRAPATRPHTRREPVPGT
jgi:hypothetical protein